MSLLGGVVPYCMLPGNHDIAPGATTRDTKMFNKHFGVWRFQDKPWYGGSFENSSDNAFYFPDVGPMKLMVLCLEFGPRDEVLNWANKVVAEHRRYKTIVVTHCYMNFDETKVGPGDKYNPHSYSWRGNDGEEMWEKFVRKHHTIILVLSGHILGDGLGKLTSYSDHGTKVNQILANYQMLENGGNGWLRVMKFVPQENRIEFATYSPTLDEYTVDEQNQFVLEESIY